MIYLDANATTPPDPVVIEAMLPFLTERYGNPSASYDAGRIARKAVENARLQVAGLLAAEASEILFTSGATESINSVLLSAQRLWPDRPLLVISATEHAATLECASRWEAQGGRVKRVSVDRNGLLDLEAFRTALEAGQTALVSMLWANNETGVIQPMEEIVDLAHSAGALVHVDAVQMMGKIPVNVQAVPVDFLSLSGHKMHAPKGVGALFVSRRVAFEPLMVGGGQETDRRSGTENVPGIVALGKAAELAMSLDLSMLELRQLFEEHLLAELPDIHIHGLEAPRLPNTSSIYFPGVDSAGLLIRLDKKGIACSGGSACHTASLHPSHVLEAMGYDAVHAGSTLRFSLSRLTTRLEIEQATPAIIAAVHYLREQQDVGVVG